MADSTATVRTRKSYYVPYGAHAQRELRRLLREFGVEAPRDATVRQLYAMYFAVRERRRSA